MYSASTLLVATVTLELLAMLVIALMGGSLSTELVTMLTLAALPFAFFVSLLPGLRAPAEITFLRDGLIRECRGRQEYWLYGELTEVTTEPTEWRGVTRYLLLFNDPRGEEQSIMLPWKMDRSEIMRIMSQQDEPENTIRERKPLT